MKAIQTFYSHQKLSEACFTYGFNLPPVSDGDSPFLYLLSLNESSALISIILHNNNQSFPFFGKDNGEIISVNEVDKFKDSKLYPVSIVNGSYQISSNSSSEFFFVPPTHCDTQEKSKKILDDYNSYINEGLFDYKILRVSQGASPKHIKTNTNIIGPKNTISNAIDDLKFYHLQHKIMELTNSTNINVVTLEQLNLPFIIPIANLLELKHCQIYNTNILSAKYTDSAAVYNWEVDSSHPTSMTFSGISEFPDFSLDSFINTQIKRDIKDVVTDQLLKNINKPKKVNLSH